MAGVFGGMLSWLQRRRSLAALESRESLDDERFYNQYYANSTLPKSLVVELRHEVADALKVPVQKLRPDDRFGKDIGTYWIISDNLDMLAVKGRNRAKALGRVVDLQKLNTVDDYIRCFAAPGEDSSSTRARRSAPQ